MRIQIFKFAFVFPAVVFGMTLAESVFGDPLTGEEIEVLLKELDTIQGVLDGNRVSLRTSAVQTFTAAAASDNANVRVAHVHTWFDALRTLRAVHRLRDGYCPSVSATRLRQTDPESLRGAWTARDGVCGVRASWNAG